MDDILIGHIVVKDGVTMLETETDVWVRQPKSEKVSANKDTDTNERNPVIKNRSKVCWDCDHSCFINSECEYYCSLTGNFTKGYCEVADL
jgi:hypothetical protein